MAVRTGKGDTGFTDLSFRKHISKDSIDISAIGDLDELISYLGLIKNKVKSGKNRDILERIQRTVHMIVSEIAVGAEKKEQLGLLLRGEEADWIKEILYQLERKTRVESCFYLPGDNELSAFIDITRTVARRAERSVVGLFRKDRVKNDNILTYLNCISDILFVMARERSRGGEKRPKKAALKGKKRRSVKK
ncbi:MAG: cob(I)yrinic acid a,c-diamide adenosyltransferase [Candidatus Omnitrophota bacterium]|nr:cob(I)yrinic acid a,c-diamide adenosyltransferase [Candidatus Omnitrophota bacterium]